MNHSNTGANTNTLQILIDALVLSVAFGLDWLLLGRNYTQEEMISFTVLAAVFCMIFILAKKQEYLYNVTLFYYVDRVFRKLTKAYVLAGFATIAILFTVMKDIEDKKFFIMYILFAYAVIIIKMIIYRPLNKKFGSKNAPRTVFVGRAGMFNKFRYFLDKTSICMDVVGYIAMTMEDIERDTEHHYLGSLEDLEELIRENHVDQVYIMQKEGELLRFTQKYVDLCIDMGVTVRLVVDFYKRRRASSFVSTVGTYPIIAYHTISLNTYERVVKRILDILGGLVGAIVFSPVMLVTAIAIKLDSPGPVMFKQTRVGQNGRHFKIYKFRSMYIDAEERKKELMAQNEIQGGVMFKMKDDPRVTKVGKFIRKFSIDELPQFFNVIEGTMSLVGTRPPTLDEVEKYERKQWRRISIKPGITGMWQVSGRSTIDNFDEIVEMDVDYIDNWSLMLDVKIMFKTVLVLLNHKGAY